MWPILEELGDARSNYLIERMIPGDVFHVDAIVSEKKVVFAEVHRLPEAPASRWCTRAADLRDAHVPRGSAVEKRSARGARAASSSTSASCAASRTPSSSAGRDDGKFYFLETAARVGGAHIADLVEASTGVNLWREWAKIEITQGESPYAPPVPARRDYGGLHRLASPGRRSPTRRPTTYPEIVWRLEGNPNHVGLIVRASTPERVEELLNELEPRVRQDFIASMPAPKAATA